MGLAALNVWVHDKQDPCKISDGFWFVAVTYCNGNSVEWCGHAYEPGRRNAATRSFSSRPDAISSAPFSSSFLGRSRSSFH